MNILFVISSLKHGGAEKQTVNDANYFSSDNKVVIVTFRGGELRESVNEKVKVIEFGKKNYLNAAKILNSIIINEKTDVINASLFSSMIISVLAAKKTSTPVFWYFHSHEYDVKLKSKLAFNFFSKKKCLKKIYFVSEELKNNYRERKFSFPENKTDILYNNFSVSENKKDIEPGGEKIIIGYIGRLVALKRAEYLIELAGYLRKEGIEGFGIEIVGDGIMKADMERLSVEKGLSDFISFKGFQKDVEKYYDRFGIFALPSREECLNISLIDACIKGIPAVAFDTGGNKEIIIDEETGFIVNTKQDFFRRIKDLIGDKIKRESLGNAAREFCKNKFSSTKRYEKMTIEFNKQKQKN